MFHRETGVFKTSYASDMALYPLPIARGTVIAFRCVPSVMEPRANICGRNTLPSFFRLMRAVKLRAVAEATGKIRVTVP